MSSLRRFELHDEELVVRFDGLLSLKTLRRRLVVPYERIVSISATPFDRRDRMIRVAGFALGSSLHGLFRRRGSWLFLSFEDPSRVVDIELDSEGARWPQLSEVILGAPDPSGLAAELTVRAPSR